MMERDIVVGTVDTERHPITLCDKCGLQAEEPVRLYRLVKSEVLNGPRSVDPESTPKKLWQDTTPVEIEVPEHHGHFRARGYQRLYEIPAGDAALYETFVDRPVTEICCDCYNEVFGW